MKSFIRFLTTTILTLVAATAGRAQVPGIITYQGRVTANGTNFTGNGQFKFALLNGSGGASLWSNDGSSVNGSQPTAHVVVPVTGGLFTVALGDTPMQTIPLTVFVNPDVRLRIWFNNGISGFAQLVPDQRITSVGYAMISGNIVDGTITTTKLAPGVLNATNLAANSVTSVQLADTIALGTTNLNGRLDIYRTTASTPAISLIGSDNQISTYGDDGLEQTRLWGPSYGELLLFNSLANNAQAVRLTAQGSSGGQLLLKNTNGSDRALLEGENIGGTLTLYTADGNIGSVLYGNEGAGSGALSLRNTNGSPRLRAYGGPTSGRLENLNDAGTLTTMIHNVSDAGVVSVRNTTGAETVYLWGRDSGNTGSGQIGLKESDGTETLTLQAAEVAGDGAQIVLRRSDGTATITLDANQGTEPRVTVSGTVSGKVIEITGGSDLSESFNVNAATADPGMIVAIDPRNPGELLVSTEPYNKKVAGIISGAGGVKPGLLMGQRGSVADGRHPVALTGRVYCWVDADAAGPVEPGDLLTTSSTPGHGMKVTDHARAAGAIIGKAMTPLAQGKGLVLVLVSLQ